ISSQTTSIQMVFANSNLAGSSNMKRAHIEMVRPNWSWLQEPIGVWESHGFSKFGLVEQIKTTSDSSDYLWYTTSIQVDNGEAFLKDGTRPILHVESLGHDLHVFINGQFA
ncbi:hypothetical protein KI387_032621, partial [Taxus chinensis]